MKICTRGEVHSMTFDPGLSYSDDLKHLPKGHWVNCIQISYRTSRGGGNKSLSKPSRSHNQYGCHAHICLKKTLKSSSPGTIDQGP